MLCEDDVVVITCEHPEGASERVFGRVGVIVSVEIDEGDLFYEVKDMTGSEYTYDDSELRNAAWQEISDAFVQMVKAN